MVDQVATKEEADYIRKHEKESKLGKPDWSALPPPTAAEAADLIRPHWGSAPPQVSPEEQHKMLFLADVCRSLGVEPDAANTAQVEHLMDTMGIPIHSGHDYPKAVYAPEPDRMGRPVALKYPPGHPRHGEDVVFADAEEEAAYSSGPAVPADAPDAADGRRRKPKDE